MRVVVAVLFVSTLSLRASQDPYLILSAPRWTNGQLQFVLAGEANVSYTIEGSSNLVTWLPLATNNVTNVTRLINVLPVGENGFYRASRAPIPLRGFALAARQGIYLKGNSILIDSYDSSDPNYSTGGRYDPGKAKDNGNMAVTNTAQNSLNVGNAEVIGRVYVPDFDVIQIGPNGSVGSFSWVDGGMKGIEPGRAIQERYYFGWPDVSDPSPSGTVPSGGNIGGTNYQYILTFGTYAVSSLTGNLLVQESASATLLVTDTLHGNIYMASGATLRLYAGAASATLSTIVNSGTPANFQYYGLPGNTNLTCTSTEHVGTIYAPNAAIHFGVTQFEGACLAMSVEANGAFRFHCDEYLTGTGGTR